MSEGYAGRLIITWPRSQGAIFDLHCRDVVLTDADTSRQITNTFALDVLLPLHVDAPVTAILTMLVDAGGQPLTEGATPVMDDDGENIRSGRFHWVVSEMRIADE